MISQENIHPCLKNEGTGDVISNNSQFKKCLIYYNLNLYLINNVEGFLVFRETTIFKKKNIEFSIIQDQTVKAFKGNVVNWSLNISFVFNRLSIDHKFISN